MVRPQNTNLFAVELGNINQSSVNLVDITVEFEYIMMLKHDKLPHIRTQPNGAHQIGYRLHFPIYNPEENDHQAIMRILRQTNVQCTVEFEPPVNVLYGQDLGTGHPLAYQWIGEGQRKISLDGEEIKNSTNAAIGFTLQQGNLVNIGKCLKSSEIGHENIL